MDDRERALLRQQYELQLKLFDAQGEEIAALQAANRALQRSHELLGQMLTRTGRLRGPQ